MPALRFVLVPLLAVSGVAFAVWRVSLITAPLHAAEPVAPPASSPFSGRVTAAGLIEAASENIALGVPVGGVVSEVAVHAGDRVSAGQLLLRLDDRVALATVAQAEAGLAAAQAQLARLQALPRAEDLPPVAARLAAASAERADAQQALARATEAGSSFPADESDRRRGRMATSEARVAEAEAELARLRAGAWAPDLANAQAEIARATAAVATAQANADQLRICAPLTGTILQVSIHVGEYAQPQAGRALLLLGDTTILVVRADVDEHDAWRLKPGATARASLRGNSALAVDLDWVRTEPYVVPKRSLTGDSTERVDTRVLQVLFRFTPGDQPFYVGQQVDVFIAADEG